MLLIIKGDFMMTKEIKSVFILLLTAAIWGLAFVAQRMGMEYVGAFTFNGIRFALGSVSLLPVIYFFDKSSKAENSSAEKVDADLKTTIKSGAIAGCILPLILLLMQT